MIVECLSVKCVFNIRQVSHSCADAGFEYIFPVRFMVRLHRDQSRTYRIDAIHIEAREGRQTVRVMGFNPPYLNKQKLRAPLIHQKEGSLIIEWGAALIAFREMFSPSQPEFKHSILEELFNNQNLSAS